MPTKTAAPEFYFPTLDHLRTYNTTLDDCGCDSCVKGHKKCKHQGAVKMYLEAAQHPINNATLSTPVGKRPHCYCEDFDRFGECVHVYALQAQADEVAKLEALRKSLMVGV